MAFGHPNPQELAAHFDGEGDRATAAHIDECDRCQAALLELKRLRSHLRSAPLPDPLEDPPPRAPAIQATGGRPGYAPTNPAGAGPLIAIAVVIIVILLLVFLL